MFHHFSLDPRVVLGVSADASAEEIHRAFLAKSKKHHPDVGGDEWAFKMVARAYEILKATDGDSPRFRPPPQPSPADQGPIPPRGEASSSPSPNGKIFTVEAEIVWIRYEGSPLPPAQAQETAMTLSVCLVISWPQASLVKHSSDFPESAEVLRVVIQAFDHLKAQPAAIDSRSRIEDGRFVGWLSYPNVLQAEAAFHSLQGELQLHQLGIDLTTRDEQVPVDWLER